MKTNILLFLLLNLVFTQQVHAESVNLRLNVNFNTNEAGFGERGEKTLNRLFEVANTLSEVEVLISGHTDSTGPEEYNEGLSLRRADSVAEYLKFRGISGDRVSTKGFGETAPIADNSTKEGRSKNRRVVASMIGLTRAELAQVMQFLRKEPAPPVAAMEAIEEAAPVEEYKKELALRKKKKSKRFYVTGFFGPHWSSAYYGDDLGHEHGKFTFLSFGIDTGMKISKKWFLDAYFYYLPTSVGGGNSGIDFVGVDSYNYENNLYGLRLGRVVKTGRTYRLSVIGGLSSHIIGGLEPVTDSLFNFTKFQHLGVTMGIRHEQKITSKWVFDSDLAYLFPLGVGNLSDSSGTLWYRGILGVKRKLTNRLRLGIEYQAVYHESEFVYESGRRSKPEFFIQTLMAGLKYNF